MLRTHLAMLDSVVEDARRSQHANSETATLQSILFLLHEQPKLLELSLEALDNSKENFVKEYTNPTIRGERRMWRVKASSQEISYLCFESFCSCPSFIKSLRGISEFSTEYQAICKHLIAVRLARALKKEVKEELNSVQFAQNLS